MTYILLGLVMTHIILGKEVGNGREVGFDSDGLARHLHLIGATGSGKTTALLTILRQILTATHEKACIFVIDPMGNLSRDLLRWMANTRYCPSGVRRRLLYIEAARENIVMPFNPLIHESAAHEYYQVERAISLVLRAWESQELSAMPRLRKWCFAAFLSVARMRLPIAVCEYLLQPGCPEHDALIGKLPPDIRYEWQEILRAKGSEAIRILESTRNRLDPFFRSVILKRMFGSRTSNFDVERFIRERRIVILNLESARRLPEHLAGAIGGLALNEVFQASMRMNRADVQPTYLILDEFQTFISPDVYAAIPTVRQQGLRLVLSHQSFSQLEQGDIDLTGLIWQPRNRIAFACDSDDADTLAHEFATHTFDPMRIKHQLMSHRQRIAGYRKELLQTWATTLSTGRKKETSRSNNQSEQQSESREYDDINRPTRTRGLGKTSSRGDSEGTNEGESTSSGKHVVNVPIHEDVEELSSVTFKSFDEERIEWGRRIPTQSTGQAVAKFYNDPKLYDVAIDEDPIPDSRRLQEAMEELIQKNFESDVFVSAARLDIEAEEIRLSLFQSSPIIVPGPAGQLRLPAGPSTKNGGDHADPSGLE